MGRLQGRELANFEQHLLHCGECQNAVGQMDLLLVAIQNAAAHRLGQGEPPAGLVARFLGEYLIVQAALPNMNIENIGILLLDVDCDALYLRFRRDFEEFAGDEADWFEQFTNELPDRVTELGARRALEWMESTFSNTVQISPRTRILVEDYATTLHELYAKHIRPNVLRFRTHLPQYSLEAAAGKFGRKMDVEPEGWIEIHADIPLTDDMFVVHVVGHSMEPDIPNDCLCVCRATVPNPLDGRVLLIEQYGEGGNRYTIKRCYSSTNVDPNQQSDEAWLHERITLVSINPKYESWDIGSAEMTKAIGEFLFVV